MGQHVRLCDSLTLCRLCGKESDVTESIYSKDGVLSMRSINLQFFLPVDLKDDSPFPRRVCSSCVQDFDTWRVFFTRLNRGQALLSKMLFENERLDIPMPDMMERPIFTVKYPSCIKRSTAGLQRRPAPAKPPRKTNNRRRSTHLIVPCDITEDAMSADVQEERGPGKRARRAPRRLVEESFAGSDLDKRLNKEFRRREAVAATATSLAAATTTNCSSMIEEEKPIEMLEERQPPLQPPPLLASPPPPPPPKVPPPPDNLFAELDLMFPINESSEPQSQHQLSHLDLATDVNLDDFRVVLNELDKTLQKPLGESAGKGMDERDLSSENYQKDTLAQTSEEPAAYQCKLCPRSFNYASSLAYHNEVTHVQQMFDCGVCGKIFNSRQVFQRHQNVVHNEDRPHVCECGKAFKTITNLKNHQVVHTGEQKFFCKICDKRFAYRTSHEAHMKIHSGERQFSCPHCDKSFVQKGNLHEHIRIHTGEKPFSCSLCPRKFTTSSQKSLHEKRHQEKKKKGKPESFLDKETCETFVRQGEKEKPFACEACDKTFSDSGALTKHMKRSHPEEKQLECETCGKTFAESWALAKHKRSHPEPGEVLERLPTDTPATPFTVLTTVPRPAGPKPDPWVDKVIRPPRRKKASPVIKPRTQVWNVLAEAAKASETSAPKPTETQHSSSAAPNVQQVIYVSYEPDEASPKPQIKTQEVVEAPDLIAPDSKIAGHQSIPSHLAPAVNQLLDLASSGGTINPALMTPTTSAHQLPTTQSGEVFSIQLDSASSSHSQLLSSGQEVVLEMVTQPSDSVAAATNLLQHNLPVVTTGHQQQSQVVLSHAGTESSDQVIVDGMNLTIGGDGSSYVKEEFVMADKSGKEQQALHSVTIPITYATSQYMQQIVMPDNGHQQISKHCKKSEFRAQLLEVISNRVKWFGKSQILELYY